MNWRFWIGGCLLIGGMACQPGQVDQQQALTVPGVSLELANFRKATDLKKRLWFTLGALVVFRLLSFVPLPGIDPRTTEKTTFGTYFFARRA